MDFSEKMKKFMKEKNLNNREICKVMDNYNEQLFSKQINKKTASPSLVFTMARFFDVDLNHFLKTEEMINTVNEKSEHYKTRVIVLIDEIEARFTELKKIHLQ